MFYILFALSDEDCGGLSTKSFIVETAQISAKSALGTLGINEWSGSELGEAKLLNLTHFVLSLRSTPSRVGNIV